MKLPKRIYELVPHIWLALGLVFMSASLYLGSNYAYTKYYFVTGVLCAGLSMYVFTARLLYRSRHGQQHADDRTPQE